MKVILLYFLGLLALNIGQVHGQVNDVVWQKCLGTNETDDPRCIAEFRGKYYIGISISTTDAGVTNFHGKGDAWINCLDSLGNLIWERCYGGSEGDSPIKIVPIDDKEIFLFNFSVSEDGDVQNGRPGNFWVVRINEHGDILWENSYGNRTCSTRDALLMPDGGLLMMGRILSAGGDVSVYYGSNDIWLCCIDSKGKIKWERTYGNVYQDNAIKIKLSSENTILMIGGHYTSGGMIDCPDLGDDGADVWIVELDLNGNLLDQWCFGGSHNDLGYDIIEMHDGYAFVASTNSNDGDVSGLHGMAGDIYHDIWVVKLNKQGEIIWQRCLGGSKTDSPVYVTQTEDSGYIIIGTTWSHNGDVVGNHSMQDFPDIWLVKVDSIGELEWQRCFGGINNERFWYPHGVTKKGDFNYVVAGQSVNISGDVECDLYGFPDRDAWIFEIKDCALFMPEKPGLPAGSDSVCTSIDTITAVQCEPASGAWYYEWDLSPVEAGTIIGTNTEAIVTWTKNWEGYAVISVRSVNDCGYSDWSDSLNVTAYNNLGISNDPNQIIALHISPNPFTTSTTLSFRLGKPENVQFTVYNVQSKIVYTMQEKQQKGEQQVRWNAEGMPAGVYYFRLQAGETVGGGKMVKMK